MLAYRRVDFEAEARHRAITAWGEDGLIDAQAAGVLGGKFPAVLYSPNPFIRIGLFVFGFICGGAALGLLFLMLGAGRGGSASFATVLLIYGVGALGMQEMLARKPKPFFRAGVEEACAYSGLLALISGMLILARFHGDLHAGLALFLALVFALAAVRYADSLLTALSLAGIFFALFDLGSDYGERATFLLPPAIILLSAAVATGCGWAARHRMLEPWAHLWSLLRLLGLLTAYAGGNYFVVREAGAAMLHVSLPAGADIPLAPLFYAHTFGLPLAYLAYGLARKDRQFLDAGLLIFAAAVFTYKRYHNVMSIEMGLTLAGFALIAAAWAALKAFKSYAPARFGITSAPAPRSGGLLNAESLALWDTFVPKDVTAQNPGGPEGFQGGGGKFGGGGAQGNF